MVKSLETLSLEKLTINCAKKNFEVEEFKIFDLTQYCLIGTFLQNCDCNNYLDYADLGRRKRCKSATKFQHLNLQHM